MYRSPESFNPEPEKKKILKIEYASDDDILNACTEGFLDWEYSEAAELATPLEEMSDKAKKARGMAYLMLKEGFSEREAAEEYEKLLPFQERKIPYLSERVEALLKQGVIKEEDYQEFKNSQFEPAKIRALLYGLSPEEADQYRRLHEIKEDEKTLKKVRILYGKMMGLDEEQTERFITTFNSKDRPEEIRLALLGFPKDLAKHYEELLAKLDQKAKFNKQEAIEWEALKDLRSVLSETHTNTETFLAIRDFGIQRFYRYLTLREKSDSFPEEKSLTYGIGSRQLSETDADLIQNRLSELEDKYRLPAAEASELEETITELRKEPLLRHYEHRRYWKDFFSDMGSRFS